MFYFEESAASQRSYRIIVLVDYMSGMEVGSPENILQDLSEFLMEGGELDLNFGVAKVSNAEHYGNNFPSNSGINIEPSEHREQLKSSCPLDMRKTEISGSPEYFRCFPETEFDDGACLDVTTYVTDPENLQYSLKDNQREEETKGFYGNDICKTSFEIEERTLQNDIETEVSGKVKELHSPEGASQKQGTDYRPPFLPSDNEFIDYLLGTSNYDLTRSEIAYEEVGDEVSDHLEDNLYSSPRLHWGIRESTCKNMNCLWNYSGDSEKLEVIQSDHPNYERNPQKSKSPGTVTHMSDSPGICPNANQSPSSHGTFDSQVLRDISCRQKCCYSVERSDLGKEVPSSNNSLPAPRQNPASLYNSRQESQHMYSYSVEPRRLSPRNCDLHQKYQRQDRPRSPMRRRNSSSRNWKDHYYRSRSRSPYEKDHYRRSPRRRYLPRNRSPSSRYHSYHRLPKRQPWSPPCNRSTGLGEPGRNLFVAGFSFITTERDLEKKFSRFGRVRDVRIVRDKRSGDSRGFGFLTLERDEDADAAIRALDKTRWNDRIVLVEKSKSH